MCLVTRYKNPFRMKEDTVVWKVLAKFGYLGAGKYFSPWQKQEYNFGMVYPDRHNYVVTSKYLGIYGKGDKIIEGGYLHAYTTEESAIHAANSIARSLSSSSEFMGCFVFKMIIPKGERYFLDAESNEICSKVLKFEEQKYVYSAVV